jgi:hypothetical protein
MTTPDAEGAWDGEFEPRLAVARGIAPVCAGIRAVPRNGMRAGGAEKKRTATSPRSDGARTAPHGAFRESHKEDALDATPSRGRGNAKICVHAIHPFNPALCAAQSTTAAST